MLVTSLLFAIPLVAASPVIDFAGVVSFCKHTQFEDCKNEGIVLRNGHGRCSKDAQLYNITKKLY